MAFLAVISHSSPTIPKWEQSSSPKDATAVMNPRGEIIITDGITFHSSRITLVQTPDNKSVRQQKM